MRRLGLALALLAFVSPLVQAQPPTPEQRRATVKYLQSLRREGGGFAAEAKADSPATVPATASALRALKYFGGSADEPAKCEAFLKRCCDERSGAYKATPAEIEKARQAAGP